MNLRPAVIPTSRQPLLAALGYLALVAVLLAVAGSAVGDLMDKRAAVAEAADALDRLQGRKPPRAGDGAEPWSGAPVLEGPTVTVAGAVLMQRIAAAVERAGGRITSSRPELQGTPYGAGFVAVAASLDIGEDALQKLLYDIEAGQPFLFVDQLAIQSEAPASGGRTVDGGGQQHMALKVTFTVYGQWRGAP
ncbi:type II secretion system protein GspM [Xanthobacter autotrophicus]|uniref:type II secretion system protein GspM n=1 Tax=Xanthobacter autotrophicus TaxID=280 RepID=UPI0024A765FD|nr:type II secretion system protein GspM [Xanthobacter autotrophicus]MDI4659051.1 type II secretion system protein M [Xanthobacter autotrophicus]